MNYRYLNLKYALINIFFFCLYLAVGGYANNYLLARGFTSSVIGVVLSAANIIALVVQTSIAPILDRSEKVNEKNTILTVLAIACICFAAVPVLPDGSGIIPVISAIGYAMVFLILPFLNSITFLYESEGYTINYGLSRGLGSFSYAMSGQLVGVLISKQTAVILPYIQLLAAVATMATVLSLKIPKKTILPEHKNKSLSYGSFFRKYKRIIPIVLSMTLLFFCHLLLNSFMIDLLIPIGGDSSSQGTCILIQALAELPTMFAFSYLLRKYGVNKLMVVASIAFFVKHLLLFLATGVSLFYVAMILQMFGYAIMIPGSVYFADKYVEPEDRSKGQTVFAAAISLGGILSGVTGGILLSALGAHGTLLVSVIVSLTGVACMLFGIRRMEKK